jgi:hypothetical protein
MAHYIGDSCGPLYGFAALYVTHTTQSLSDGAGLVKQDSVDLQQ